MATVDLQLACDQYEVPDLADIQTLVELTLARAESSASADPELCLRVVDAAEMQVLNRDYRGKDRPTNVLSFPADKPIGLPADADVALGDVVVCAEVVATEAAAQGKSAADHWAHLIVHGTLHLLGYDHQEDSEAEAMEGLEIRILAERGIGDPYASRQ